MHAHSIELSETSTGAYRALIHGRKGIYTLTIPAQSEESAYAHAAAVCADTPWLLALTSGEDDRPTNHRPIVDSIPKLEPRGTPERAEFIRNIVKPA